MPIRRRLDAAVSVFFRIVAESDWGISGLAEIHQNGLVHPRSQEVAVTVLGHPARTREVIVMDTTGALTISVRIESEKDVDDLRPGPRSRTAPAGCGLVRRGENLANPLDVWLGRK